MKRFRRNCCACCLLPVAVVAAVAWWVSHLMLPLSGSRRTVIVRVRRGEAPGQLAHDLERRGLLRSRWAFLIELHRKGGWSHVRSGAYRLSPNMTPDEMVDRLRRGPTENGDRRVTIPEGYTVRQIADAMAHRGVVASPTAFVEAARHPGSSVAAPFALPKTGLEGYLFPETYQLPSRVSPAKAAQSMVDMFVDRFYRPYRARIAASPHTLYELVTIASLIEREARLPQDRAKIAGVIENRLARHMRLQIDATVLYALGHHKDRVLFRDLAVQSPYNTYRHPGLPPGPIASPGIDSLKAALEPDRNPYLYYVLGPGGAHVFSRTEAEHLRNVARLRAMRNGKAEAIRG